MWRKRHLQGGEKQHTATNTELFQELRRLTREYDEALSNKTRRADSLNGKYRWTENPGMELPVAEAEYRALMVRANLFEVQGALSATSQEIIVLLEVDQNPKIDSAWEAQLTVARDKLLAAEWLTGDTAENRKQSFDRHSEEIVGRASLDTDKEKALFNTVNFYKNRVSEILKKKQIILAAQKAIEKYGSSKRVIRVFVQYQIKRSG